MPKLAYYVTSHGYGHFLRTLEIIKDFKGWEIWILTDFNKIDITEFHDEVSFQTRHSVIDIGVVQHDALEIDIEQTLEKNLELEQQEKQILQREVDFIHSENIDIIFSDIPPLAFKIAQLAGIPCYGVSNFSWDWIYDGLAHYHRDYLRFSVKFYNFYQMAAGLFQLPFAGPMRAFKKIYRMGLVRRSPAIKSPQQIRKLLNIPQDAKVMLLTFGGQEYLPPLRKIEGLLYLVPGKVDRRMRDSYIEVSTKNFSHPDLVVASDIIFSKPGYGILSEIWDLPKLFIYTDRGPFREYEVLKKYIEKHIPSSIYIPSSAVRDGSWLSMVESKIFY
ncbi:MAG: hypothetical protein ACP5FK_00250 [bacterium]